MNRYSFLSLPIREELTKRITSVCKSFGLEDLYYDVDEFLKPIKEVKII